MAKIRTLQIYRGTTAQNNAYTGSAGELTMDTTTNELRLHDGSTVGGHIIGSGGGGSSGYHPDLFDYKWADHICNDVQWLRADTFSWQSGAVYQAAYQHLTTDITGKTLQSETISGTTIQFYLADDGHKICPVSEESNVTAIYNATGVAWYYIIDTTNQRFKLPRRHSQQVVRSVKNADGSWYRLYADSWVEQGGVEIASGTMITLPIAMANTKYTVQTTPTWGTADSSGTRGMCSFLKTTTSFKAQQDNNSGSFDWQVSGQSAIDMSSFQDGEKYLYFYVGEFTQSAIVNTAGLNAELFNTKADVSTVATATAHVVTEFQEPTSANNYIWYRKYNDGWVEQGGPQSTINTTINLPVEMADTNYAVDCGIHIANYGDQTLTKRTTSFSTGSVVTNVGTTGGWTVKGMAA